MASPSKSPPRAALIGVSGYGRIHLELLEEARQRGQVEFVAATIINLEEEAKTADALRSFGCAIYSDYREMLQAHRGRLELCCVPTPIPLHAPMSAAALEAGAHVLVEKPIAATVAEVETISAAESASGKFVAVGFQDIYAEENLSLKAALLSGAIGPIRRIRGRGLWPRDTGYYRRNNWAGRRKVDGAWVLDSPLSNAFSHFLNLALFFAGTEALASAAASEVTAELFRAQPIENFDTAALRVMTAGGAEILFYVTHSCLDNLDPELCIEGDKGRIFWRRAQGVVTEIGGISRSTPLSDEGTLRKFMFDRVVKKLAEPSTFVCGTAIAAEHTRCCEDAQKFAVRDVPADCLERTPTTAGNEQVSIRGIEQVIDRAWTTGKLFSEIDCPWARPADPTNRR